MCAKAQRAASSRTEEGQDTTGNQSAVPSKLKLWAESFVEAKNEKEQQLKRKHECVKRVQNVCVGDGYPVAPGCKCNNPKKNTHTFYPVLSTTSSTALLAHCKRRRRFIL